MIRETNADRITEHAADIENNSEFYTDTNKLRAPVNLTLEQQALFDDIVSNKPPTYFNRTDVITLASLVRHITHADFLSDQIEQSQQLIDVRNVKTVEVYNKLLASYERESRAINAHMRSLRLTVQSRIDAKVANTLTSQTEGQNFDDPANFE